VQLNEIVSKLLATDSAQWRPVKPLSDGPATLKAFCDGKSAVRVVTSAFSPGQILAAGPTGPLKVKHPEFDVNVSPVAHPGQCVQA
jgi:hypothetical protein